MRRSEWEDRCKRHPEHRMSKGVCPSCLRDRLAHLSASSSATSSVASVFPPPRLLGLTSALADDPRCSDLLVPFPILD